MIEYASQEEKYFSWYLDELLKEGFILRYKYQPKPFVITEKIHYKWIKKLKTKSKPMQSVFLNGYTYQADFLIVWDIESDARGIFYEILFELSMHDNAGKKDDYPFIAQVGNQTGHFFSVVDVKGSYSQNDAYRRFSIDQKLVWDKHKIYVQKIIPVPAVSKSGKVTPANALFHQTFTPFNYRFTDKKGDKRKIRYNLKTLQEFLAQ